MAAGTSAGLKCCPPIWEPPPQDRSVEVDKVPEPGVERGVGGFQTISFRTQKAAATGTPGPGVPLGMGVTKQSDTPIYPETSKDNLLSSVFM